MRQMCDFLNFSSAFDVKDIRRGVKIVEKVRGENRNLFKINWVKEIVIDLISDFDCLEYVSVNNKIELVKSGDLAFAISLENDDVCGCDPKLLFIGSSGLIFYNLCVVAKDEISINYNSIGGEELAGHAFESRLQTMHKICIESGIKCLVFQGAYHVGEYFPNIVLRDMMDYDNVTKRYAPNDLIKLIKHIESVGDEK